MLRAGRAGARRGALRLQLRRDGQLHAGLQRVRRAVVQLRRQPLGEAAARRAAKGIDFANEPKAVYAFHLLFGHHGWFSLTPVWLLGAGGLAGSAWPGVAGRANELVRPSRGRTGLDDLPLFGAMTLAVSVVVFRVLRLCRTNNYGGFTSGPRWLFWLTPLWLLGILPAADRIGRVAVGRVRRGGAARVLGAVGLLPGVEPVAAAVDPATRVSSPAGSGTDPGEPMTPPDHPPPLPEPDPPPLSADEVIELVPEPVPVVRPVRRRYRPEPPQPGFLMAVAWCVGLLISLYVPAGDRGRPRRSRSWRSPAATRRSFGRASRSRCRRSWVTRRRRVKPPGDPPSMPDGISYSLAAGMAAGHVGSSDPGTTVCCGSASARTGNGRSPFAGRRSCRSCLSLLVSARADAHARGGPRRAARVGRGGDAHVRPQRRPRLRVDGRLS